MKPVHTKGRFVLIVENLSNIIVRYQIVVIPWVPVSAMAQDNIHDHNPRFHMCKTIVIVLTAALICQTRDIHVLFADKLSNITVQSAGLN